MSSYCCATNRQLCNDQKVSIARWKGNIHPCSSVQVHLGLLAMQLHLCPQNNSPMQMLPHSNQCYMGSQTSLQHRGPNAAFQGHLLTCSGGFHHSVWYFMMWSILSMQIGCIKLGCVRRCTASSGCFHITICLQPCHLYLKSVSSTHHLGLCLGFERQTDSCQCFAHALPVSYYSSVVSTPTVLWLAD